MNFNFTAEIIIRILMAIALMVIVGRVITPLIFNFYRTLRQKEHTSANNLNFLIQMQEDRLRRGRKVSATEQQLSTGTNENPTLAVAYQNEFKNFTSDHHGLTQKEDIKKIFSLLDELQWGTGKELSRIQGKIFNLVKEKIDLTQINHSCKQIFNSNKLPSLLPKMALPNFGQLQQMVAIRSICEYFALHLTYHPQEALPITRQWAQKIDGQIGSVHQGIDLCLQILAGRSEEKVFKFLLDSPGEFYISHLNSGDLHKMLTSGIFYQHKILEWSILQGKIIEFAQIVESTTPVPALQNDQDIAQALHIFQLQPSDSWEKIKKKYKLLAISKHPDKITIPYCAQKFNALAHTNFQNIQRAYDVLKKYKN